MRKGFRLVLGGSSAAYQGFRIMEIIISPMCESITGSLGSGFGYHIQRRKNGFFGKRNSKGDVPPDGHLRFIFTCAELAQNRMHIADIRVTAEELRLAFNEAHMLYGDRLVKANAKYIFNAHEVLKYIKKWCSL